MDPYLGERLVVEEPLNCWYRICYFWHFRLEEKTVANEIDSPETMETEIVQRRMVREIAMMNI